MRFGVALGCRGCGSGERRTPAPPPAGPAGPEVSAVPSRSGRPARHVHVLGGVPEQRKFVFPRDPPKAQSISLLNCVRMHLATNICETKYLPMHFYDVHLVCNARLRDVYTSQRTFANCIHLATHVCETCTPRNERLQTACMLQRTFAKRIITHLATNVCKLHTPCNTNLRNV